MTHPIPNRQDGCLGISSDPRQERKQALWALTQQLPVAEVALDDTPDASPTDLEIAALLDGRLDAQDRERVLAALEADDEAATVWLTAAAALEREAIQEATPSSKQHRRAWFQKPQVWAIAASIAIVATLATYPFLFGLSGVSGRIDQDLRLAIANGWQPPATGSSAYGFRSGQRPATDAVTQAIHAGYSAAIAQFDAPDSATSAVREPVAAYHSGRWLALLEAAAPETASADFWAAQLRTGQRLTNRLSAQPDSTNAQSMLGRLVQHLDAGAPDFDARWQQLMQRELNRARFELDLPQP